jgi:hypothetical protein
MRIVIATHGHCFDGLASAALFSHLMHCVHGKNVALDYFSCSYGPHHEQPSKTLFDGDENALLDFQFSDIETLTWYFDHHSTAFPTADLLERFESKVPSGRYFYDPKCGSCARLISEVMLNRFGCSLGLLEPLWKLADRVDSAKFDSAHAAIDRSTPQSRLVAIAERHGNSAFLKTWVPRLLERPVDEVARHPEVEREFSTIHREQETFVEHLRHCAVNRGSVVYADMTDREHSAFTKFATYALFPRSVYSVVLGRIPGATRLAVGYNPWSGFQRRHNLGELCQSHGGGGHAVVGGVAFAVDAVERAREVALSLVRALEDG